MESSSPGLPARLFVGAQHLIPQHLLTGIVYRVTRNRNPLIKNFLIRSFVRAYHPDMSEAEQPDPLSYPTFNAFFTRALRPRARSIDPNASTLVSPVDGMISQIGRLEGNRILQAKGLSYTLASLLGVCTSGGAADSDPIADAASFWNDYFSDGSFATLYLAPFNYHRIHMPLNATLRAAWYVPGHLFSVNATTAQAVPDLFARNERIVCVFENGQISFAMVLVGALFVGSMQTVWHGEVTPRRPRRPLELPLQTATPSRLAKGAEMGRFNMGSTVILILPPRMTDWAAALEAGSPVCLGQPLARLRPHVLEDLT